MVALALILHLCRGSNILFLCVDTAGIWTLVAGGLSVSSTVFVSLFLVPSFEARDVAGVCYSGWNSQSIAPVGNFAKR